LVFFFKKNSQTSCLPVALLVRLTSLLNGVINMTNQTETTVPDLDTTETPREATPPTQTLIHTLLHAINTHIDQQVEEKVSAVLQAHGTVKYIDESFREAIKDIADEAVDYHNNENDHVNEDRVKEIMDDIITEQVRREIRDTDISNQVHDAITDYDFDDKFDAYDIDDKIENYLDSNDFPDADRVQEIVEEILEEKLASTLIKLLEKLNGV
jgi:Rps23 Pro-64 3,4-dihydroxylase Tpa1-like proline 4-hydroxylase